jgi:hypothetical protein
MYTCTKYCNQSYESRCYTSTNIKCGKCDEGLCKYHEYICDTCKESLCEECRHEDDLECHVVLKKRARQEKADKIRLQNENLDKIRLQFENLDSKIGKIMTGIDKITELFEAIIYAPNGIKYNEALKDFEERREKSE